MKSVIARRFEAVSRSLSPTAKWRLQQAVPLYQARTRGIGDARFAVQQALVVVKSSFPLATAREWDTLVLFLIAAAGIAEADAQSGAPAAQVHGLGEMESLRLQAAIERLPKLAAAVSDVQKKYEANASAIIQNMK